MADQIHQPSDDDAASLDNQLDSLLSRIKQEESAASPAGEPDPVPLAETDASLDAMIDRQVDDAIAAAESMYVAPAEAASSASQEAGDDELADQVQAMLNEATAERRAMSASPSPVGEDDALDPAVDQMLAAAEQISDSMEDDLAGSFSSPQDVAAIDTASLEVTSADGAASSGSAAIAEQVGGDPKGEADLTDLDRLLADEADDAIAGDFESPHAVARRETGALPDISSADAMEDEEMLAGSFDAPEALAAAPGTARSVARELDEQPETAAARSRGGAGGSAKDKARKRPAVAPMIRIALPKAERIARRTCALINSPLNHLDHEWRNTIGYAGLLTTLTAVALILAAVVF